MWLHVFCLSFFHCVWEGKEDIIKPGGGGQWGNRRERLPALPAQGWDFTA